MSKFRNRFFLPAGVLAALLLAHATVLAADDHHDDHAEADPHETGERHDEHADHADEHGDDHADDHADAHTGNHGSEHADEHGEEHRDAFTVRDFEASGVRVATAGPGEVDLGVELPGEVRPDADRIAHLAPRFAGIVREVRSHLGDSVRSGDVLAVIESENLTRFDLKAAFDGTVIGKHIALGETVRPDEEAYIVADLSSVWVQISVYQSALPEVKLGQPVVITAGRGALEGSGTVSYLTPIVDQATRAATARVVLANPDGAWRPGLFVTATVYNPWKAAVVIPRDALQTLEGKTVVFVADGEHFEIREVLPGRTGRTRVEIVSGLSAGERFADVRSFLVKAELAKGEGGEGHAH